MNILTQMFTEVAPLPVGTHHMQATQDEKPFRLHLRLQKDGSGLLILNASTVMQLNPTAAECAFHFIKGTAPDEAAKQISARYRVGKKTALIDFNSFADRIQTLISTPDLDPASFLDFERVQPHSADATLNSIAPSPTNSPPTPMQSMRPSRELTAN